MGPRVLATPESEQAIRQMLSIINGGLADQISQLDQQGQTLSQPNVWDGPLAIRFRDQQWPDVHQSLNRAKGELQQLQQSLDRIRQNIMAAGGGA